MSLILAIETGTDICSVGIAKDGELLHEIPLERIENLKIRTGFFSQVLRFEYEGAVFSFTNFAGVKPALEVIRQEAARR